MPVVFKGNINGEVMSETYSLPFNISYFKITNTSGGNATVNVVVQDAYSSVNLIPNNLVLSGGDMLENDTKLVMPGDNQIKITTSASVSYYFTIDNIVPD